MIQTNFQSLISMNYCCIFERFSPLTLGNRHVYCISIYSNCYRDELSCCFFHQVFISIKGIYYQVEVQGQLVTWLVPHKYTYEVCVIFQLFCCCPFRLKWFFLEVQYATFAVYNHMRLVSKVRNIYPSDLLVGTYFISIIFKLMLE